MPSRTYTGVNCMLLLLTLASYTNGDDIEVVTRLGRIVGSTLTAENAQSYVAFRGVPYAKPPVGQLRFAKPEPHPPFDSAFDASDFGSSCPQFVYTLHGDEQGTEDCLTLNIFVRELNPRQKKKVLVFIHGGAFFFTSSRRFIPGTLVTRHDIIVITFNYRLGILGFLSTETDSLPGNMGLWDQNLALKWVKENIADFGGDADDITVSGTSAGSISSTFQSLVPQSAGLFTKVIALSGAATSIFGLGYTHKISALKTAQMLGCWAGGLDADTPLDDAQNEDIVRCLRQVPWEAFTQIPPIGENASFVPRVDGDFFPDTPQRLLQNKEHLESVGFYDRIYLIGQVNNEAGVVLTYISSTTPEGADPLEVMKQYTFNMIRQRLHVYDCSPILKKIESWYKRRYSGNRVYLNIISDLNFVVATYDYLEAVTRNETTQVYLNYFDYYPGFMQGEEKGVVHGIDLVYWWDDQLEKAKVENNIGITGDLDKYDHQLKAKYTSLIADFVIHGKPNFVLQNTEPSKWINFDPRASNYLNFNLHPTVNRHLKEAERRLWLETVPEWLKAMEN